MIYTFLFTFQLHFVLGDVWYFFYTYFAHNYSTTPLHSLHPFEILHFCERINTLMMMLTKYKLLFLDIDLGF